MRGREAIPSDFKSFNRQWDIATTTRRKKRMGTTWIRLKALTLQSFKFNRFIYTNRMDNKSVGTSAGGSFIQKNGMRIQ